MAMNTNVSTFSSKSVGFFNWIVKFRVIDFYKHLFPILAWCRRQISTKKVTDGPAYSLKSSPISYLLLLIFK